MEELLHHLGCIKPCKQWDKVPYQLVSWIFSINSIIKNQDLNTAGPPRHPNRPNDIPCCVLIMLSRLAGGVFRGFTGNSNVPLKSQGVILLRKTHGWHLQKWGAPLEKGDSELSKTHHFGGVYDLF